MVRVRGSVRREGVRVKRECEKGGYEGEEGVRREGVRMKSVTMV